MSNATFDAARFGRLFRSHWSENRRGYAWFAGVAAMVDLIVIALVFITSNSRQYDAFQFDSQVMWFVTGLFTTGVIFATRYSSGLSNPGAALVALMRPASHFEKWLLAVLWVAVLFPVFYTALYALIHGPVVKVAQWLHVPPVDMGPYYRKADFRFFLPLMPLDEPMKSLAEKGDGYTKQLLVFLLLNALQAYCVGCKYFFKKASTLKMAVLAFIVFLIALGLSSVLNANFFIAATYWLHESRREWQPPLIDQVIASVVLVGVPLLLWIAAYFHLRERELS